MDKNEKVIRKSTAFYKSKIIRQFSFLICCLLFLSAAAAGRVKYEPTWQSLDTRPTPKWFTDAKFGIFIHWGIYSVPSWAPKGECAECYVGPDLSDKWYDAYGNMRNKNTPIGAFHRRVYGEHFEYKDFAAMFKAELFDPDQWAKLFKQAGAKYVVLTSKHNTGTFCLWPAPNSNGWNSVEAGPKRDLCGDLAKAVRAKGLKMGFYYGLIEWYHPYNFLYKKDLNKYINERMLPQIKDLVTRYKPSVVWTDGDWDHTSDVYRSKEFLAWLFNEAKCADEVAVNDRWGKNCRGRHGGFYTTERKVGFRDDSHPWEECRVMGSSWGYNRNESLEDYKSAKELILFLIDVVSRGGNLLLNVGPTGDGRIPVIMQQRLTQMGRWLKVNGEAIYGSKCWRNSCQWSSGKKPKIEYGVYSKTKYNVLDMIESTAGNRAIIELFFTYKGNNLYAITPRWPGKKLILKDVAASKNTVVTMLGLKKPLRWKAVDGNIVIDVPQLSVDQLPCEYAYSFKLTGIK